MGLNTLLSPLRVGLLSRGDVVQVGDLVMALTLTGVCVGIVTFTGALLGGIIGDNWG